MRTGTSPISGFGAALVAALACAACTSPARESSPSPASAPSAPNAAGPSAAPTPAAAGAPAVSDVPPDVSAVPADLLRATRADLDARLAAAKLSPAAVRVKVAESVTWSDGSIGCPKPGMMYTMALVPGYRVVYGVRVGAEEREYAYHAGKHGSFQYCEHPQPPAGTSSAA